MKETTVRKKFNKESVTGIAFVAPALVLLLVFLVIPFILTIYYGFTDYNLLKPNEKTFIGVQNYVKLFQDKVFLKSIQNTFIFVILVVPLQVVLALGLALLINKKMRGIAIFRMAFFAPTVLSLVVVSILWTYIFNPNNGLLNAMLEMVGLSTQPFLTSPTQAMICIVVLSAWQGCGFQMMIFLAGLQDIPGYLYEAAEVDGANAIDKFFHITLPGLRNISTFIALSIVISAFQLLVQPMMMTQGGPQNATMTIVYGIYQTGYKFRNVGYGSAMACVFTGMVLIITLIQKRITSKNHED